MIAYPDTSFLCALYRRQDSSPAAAAHFADMKETLHVSTLLLYEFRQGMRFQAWLHRQNPAKGFPQTDADQAQADLQSDLDSGAVVLVAAQWPDELYAFKNRAFGPYWWSYWAMISCNVISPHFFWFKKLRTSVVFVWIVSIFVNIGMWFERFVIIVTSLHRDYLPSSWGYFTPSWVDIMTFVGSFGLFMTLFLLFIRFLPVIAISEVKGVTPQADPHHPLGGAKGHH
jgi:hypothetical protein